MAQKQILESIRDIIGGDDDVLDLTEVVAKEEPKAKPANLFTEELTPEPEPADVLSEIDALLAEGNKPEPSRPITTADAEIELTDFIAPTPVKITETAAETNNGETPMTEDETLISQESANNAQAALKTLSQAVQNASRPKIDPAPFRNGDTVEDLVMDMLKPILKDWLDSNLPKLVQTIVEKEIKRLMPKE